MSTIRTNEILHLDGTTTSAPSIPALDQRMAKAWINFNGTGTVAINSSYGISSVSDLGTGVYNINWASAMPSSYAVTGGVLGSTSSFYNSVPLPNGVLLNTTYVRIQILHIDGTQITDQNSISLIAFAN